MAPSGGTAPSPHRSLWSGPATGNTDSSNLGEAEKYFTKSEGFTQSRFYLDLLFCTHAYDHVNSPTCHMLQAGVCEFGTRGQVEVLEFDQTGQNRQPRVWTEPDEQNKNKK